MAACVLSGGACSSPHVPELRIFPVAPIDEELWRKRRVVDIVKAMALTLSRRGLPHGM